MARRPQRFPILLLLALATTAVPLGAHRPAAQTSAPDQRIAFDIPAQPLDAALAQYFRITGVQLLYDSSLTAGRRSAAVTGSYAPREALRRLLADTGLVVRYSRSRSAIITAPGVQASSSLVPLGRVVVREKAPARGPSVTERLAYYSQLEHELQAQLNADSRTARLTFQVVAVLQVAPNGQVQAVRLERSSGDRRADQTLTEAIGGYAVTKPPDGLAQPLRVSLRGRRRG